MTDRPAWKSRIVGYGEERPDQLLANPRNARRHDRHQRTLMADVLDEVGYVQDVIVNRRTDTLVDGHMRVELALAHEMPTIPVKYIDLSEEEEALVLAALDASSGLAEADPAVFEELLSRLELNADTLDTFLSSLLGQGGKVVKESVYGSESTSSKPIRSMHWPGRNAFATAAEVGFWTEALRTWEIGHNTRAGFLDDLITRKRAELDAEMPPDQGVTHDHDH